MKAACELVQEKKLMLSAAYWFRILKATIQAHFHGINVGAGRPTILTPAEEKEIAVSLKVHQETDLGSGSSCDPRLHQGEEIPNPFKDDLPRKAGGIGFYHIGISERGNHSTCQQSEHKVYT